MPDNDFMRFVIILIGMTMTVGLVVATFTFVENLKKAKKTIDDVRKEVREVTNDENEDRPEGG